MAVDYERKQVTGTEANVKKYAGHLGQLAFAHDTKHLHVLSGTAGQTTELANKADIPNVSGKADKTYVDTELAKKQAKGNYATSEQLTQGLAGKQPTGDYATNAQLTQGLAGKANSSHTHTIANVTGLQEALNSASQQASNAIPKAGNRGALKGFESSTSGTTVNDSSPDTQHASSSVTVQNGTNNATTSWTKVVDMTSGSVSLGSYWYWSGGKAPTLKYPGVLTCHWNGGNNKGIAIYTAGAS